MTRTSFHRLCGSVAIFFAILPLCLFFINRPLSVWFILPLNMVGWIAAGYYIVGLEKLHQHLDRSFEKLGFTKFNDTLSKRIEFFINEFGRYYRSAFAYQELKLEGNFSKTASRDIGASLQKIVQLAYHELGAQAVELSLYDQESGLWPQAIVVGEPHGSEVQSLTLEAQNISFDDSFLTGGVIKTLSAKVAFAGTTFGALRVEFPSGQSPNQEDIAVLKLLAMQGALLLVDSRYTEELVRMKQLNEESVKAKTGFLAQLSHEIRGPLGIILNGVELNLEGFCGELSEMQRETLTMIQQAGAHLLDLVNDVLDYAKAEAGKVIVTPQTIALKPFLDDLANVVRTQAQDKGHKLTVKEIDPKLAAICDKRHARQILINFLTNAIKYTPDNGEISISAIRGANERAIISVEDNGVGISEDQRDKVFGAFERVDNEYSLKQQGTGLGMPLTAKLAKANNGIVDFESIQGKGSRFFINLPADTVDIDSVTITDDSAFPTVDGRGDTILIADGNKSSRTVTAQYLSGLGFNVVATKGGRQLLKAFREHQIAAAVIDADLGEMSGEDAIIALRGSALTIGVPLVLLSAKAFIFDIENYLRLGVDRCMTKPFALGELATTLRNLIDEAKSRE